MMCPFIFMKGVFTNKMMCVMLITGDIIQCFKHKEVYIMKRTSIIKKLINLALTILRTGSTMVVSADV